MVLAWIAATIVIIGVGSSLAGEYDADYNTPGSESKAASVLTEERFSGYSGQEIYVVWKDSGGARSPEVRERVDAFFAAAEQVDNVARHTPVRISQDGTIGASTLPLTGGNAVVGLVGLAILGGGVILVLAARRRADS